MTPEFAHIISKLNGMIEHRSADLAKGGAKDFAEYKHAAGVILGLNQAAQEIEEYARSYDD